jgi:hypothetical protein
VILSVPIKKLPPNAKGQVRYRFVVDVGIDPATGKRKQLTRTFDTLKEAKAEYARITGPGPAAVPGAAGPAELSAEHPRLSRPPGAAADSAAPSPPPPELHQQHHHQRVPRAQPGRHCQEERAGRPSPLCAGSVPSSVPRDAGSSVASTVVATVRPMPRSTASCSPGGGSTRALRTITSAGSRRARPGAKSSVASNATRLGRSSTWSDSYSQDPAHRGCRDANVHPLNSGETSGAGRWRLGRLPRGHAAGRIGIRLATGQARGRVRSTPGLSCGGAGGGAPRPRSAGRRGGRP